MNCNNSRRQFISAAIGAAAAPIIFGPKYIVSQNRPLTITASSLEEAIEKLYDMPGGFEVFADGNILSRDLKGAHSSLVDIARGIWGIPVNFSSNGPELKKCVTGVCQTNYEKAYAGLQRDYNFFSGVHRPSEEIGSSMMLASNGGENTVGVQQSRSEQAIGLMGDLPDMLALEREIAAAEGLISRHNRGESIRATTLVDTQAKQDVLTEDGRRIQVPAYTTAQGPGKAQNIRFFRVPTPERFKARFNKGLIGVHDPSRKNKWYFGGLRSGV